VEALNERYRDQGSWWHKVVEDPAAFIAVRRNCLNVYVNGGSLLKITHSPQEGLICSIHEEYLVLRSERAYVRLAADETPQVAMVSGTEGLVRHYRAIKRRIARFGHAERMGENLIACTLPEILDMEAAFGWSRGSGRRSRVGRVDLVAVSRSGRLVLIEAKLFTNPDLRNAERPIVIGQLHDYHKWQRADQLDIIAAYDNVVKLYRQLEGRFFAERVSHVPDPPNLTLYDRPRLLVFGFDRKQQRNELPAVLTPVLEAMNDVGMTPQDLVTVGSPGNLTARKLLAGV